MSWTDDIKEKVVRRIPELGNDENEFLLEDLIDDAFRSIVNHSNADAYKTAWDNVLVRCVAMLYNNIGTEGIVYRSSLDTTDTYDTTNVISSYIQGVIPHYIKPIGHIFPDTRYDYPN